DDEIRHPPQVLKTDPTRLLNRPANDAAQHVAATFVRRRYPVPDQERHPAAVVGQDAMSLVRGLAVAVRDPALAGDPVHDRLVAAGVVDPYDSLDKRPPSS